MGQETSYRLIVVRPDGTRRVIATGIPHERATEMRQILDGQSPGSKLVIEPERDLVDGAETVSMDDQLTQYELDVLRWHRDKRQPMSTNEDRREAQRMLVRLGYLTESERVFSITSKGLKRLAKRD